MTLKLCNLLLKTNISFSLKHPLKTWYDTALLHVLSLNTEIPSSVLPAVRLCYFGHHILATSLFVSTFHTSTANLFLTGRLELSSQVLLTFLPSSPLHCELFNNPSMLIITSCWHFNNATFDGSLNLSLNKKGTALIRRSWKDICPGFWLKLRVSS